MNIYICVCICDVQRNDGKTKGSNLVDTCEVYVCQMHLDYNTRPALSVRSLARSVSNAVIKHKIVQIKASQHIKRQKANGAKPFSLSLQVCVHVRHTANDKAIMLRDGAFNFIRSVLRL